jgi:hypothetical protein
MDDIKVTPKTEQETTVDGVSSEDKQSRPTIPIEDARSDSEIALIKINIASMFGVKDTDDSKFNFVFNELYNQFESKGAILEAIRNIERKTGTPRFGLGESKLGVVYNYLKSEKAINDAIKVRNSYLA